MILISNDDFIAECRTIHNDKYDYSLSRYSGSNKKVTIICPEHGEFEQIARDHKRGGNCPTCANLLRYSDRGLNVTELIRLSNKKYNNKYDYSRVNYLNLKSGVTIGCPKHGDFEQRFDVHLGGVGCKKCYLSDRGLRQRLTTEDLISKLVVIHGDKYDYSKVRYDGYTKNIEVVCPEHGTFETTCESHLHGSNCRKCYYVTSKGEQELLEFINSMGVIYETGNRNILNGKELDIYIPSHKLAIEFNGL